MHIGQIFVRISGRVNRIRDFFVRTFFRVKPGFSPFSSGLLLGRIPKKPKICPDCYKGSAGVFRGPPIALLTLPYCQFFTSRGSVAVDYSNGTETSWYLSACVKPWFRAPLLTGLWRHS